MEKKRMEAATVEEAVGMEMEMEMEKREEKPEKVGGYVVLCTILATVSSVLLGYDIGIMSGALLFVSNELSLSLIQQEIIVGSLNLVSIVGAACAGRLSDAVGRRHTMLIASAIFLAGAVVLASARSFAALLAGRLIEGIGVGFAMMIAPVYSSELAPARVRGCLVSLTEVFINAGILLGYLVSFALQDLPPRLNWRLMLGFGAIPALVLAAGVGVMPESPRWLVTQRRAAEARKVLLAAASGDEAQADRRLADIMRAVGFNAYSPNPTPAEYDAAFGHAKKQGQGVWRELLLFNQPSSSPFLKRMLLCSLCIHFFQQASGIDAAVYYSPVVFGEAGITSKIGRLGATVGVGFTKLLFIFVATALLDRVGRRRLLAMSACGVVFCLFALAVSFIMLGINTAQGDTLIAAAANTMAHAGASSRFGAAITIFFICAYVASFSIGMGPIPWVFVSEAFPVRLRAQAMGMCVFLNRLVSGIVSLTFLSISKAITPAGIFFLYGGIVVVAIVFIMCIMPETKGKSLEELSVLFDEPNNELHNNNNNNTIADDNNNVCSRHRRRRGGRNCICFP